MTAFWTALTFVEITWVVVLSAWIVMERRSPVATLAWILGLAWLPAVGIVVYYFLGPRRFERHRLKRRSSAKLARAAVAAIEEETGDPARGALARMLVKAGEAAPLPADRIDLYTRGKDCFDAIIAEIERAQHHVHVTYYIWYPDHTGTRFRDALARKAEQGVEVRLLLDWIGAYPTTLRFLAPITDAGGQVAWFHPVSLARLARRANFRTHRKIVVCDGRVGFTGGMNVSDEHTEEHHGHRAWRDTHARIEGPAVRGLQGVFVEDWHYATSELPSGREYYAPTSPSALSEAGDLLQVVASGPDNDTYAIHKLMFAAIASAHERVLITTPYFVPDEPITSALVTAALRGVDVQIIVPFESDTMLVDLAARTFFPELLRAGVVIHEYMPRFIHAKSMVVDRDLTIFGSANMDNRSFRLNFEVCAAVYGPDLATKLAAIFEEDLVHCRRVEAKALERQPLLTRLGQASARLLSPIL